VNISPFAQLLPKGKILPRKTQWAPKRKFERRMPWDLKRKIKIYPLDSLKPQSGLKKMPKKMF